MKIRGYTLTELVVVCSILVVLAAVLTPVIMRVKEAAKESVCASNLHELWAAVALYRERYEGAPAYGDACAMGPPMHTKVLHFEMGLPRSVFQCGGYAPEPGLEAAYTYIVPTVRDILCLRQDWQVYSKEVGDQMVLFVDPNHNLPDEQASPFVHNRFLAIYLDGQFKHFVKAGDWSQFDFWK